MNPKIKRFLLRFLSTFLCAVFGLILLCYTVPMQDTSLDLGLVPIEGVVPESFDNNSWTVFVQEGETAVPLESNGMGSFTGLELGQTFYFSRVMVEDLDSPTLQLGAADRNFSVFLDGELIYTDCPELDNRIGFLRLPMRERDRSEPLTIALPSNYAGKTLTIAQSFPEYSETPTIRAVPCDVRLYCGYAYESGLISQSFQIAFACLLLFALGVFLLISFIRGGDWDVFCIALMTFLLMTKLLISADFFGKYFGVNMTRYTALVRPMVAGTLLLVLTLRGSKGKKVMLGMTAVYGVSLLVAFVLTFRYERFTNPALVFLTISLPEWVAALGLVAVLIMGFLYWRKESRYYRLFTPMALALVVLAWVVSLITNHDMVAVLLASLGSGHLTYLYARLLYPLLIAALITTSMEAVRLEWSRLMEKRLTAQQQELALANYENLRHHQEEVMMLRHDMLRHFRTIQEMNSQSNIAQYLADLIGQNEKIRPVVQSGNEMLDIILNGKLSAAIDAGIHVEIVKTDAPEKLPLRDADLCSLIMNIVDNAVAAAKNAQSDAPRILLDVHCKGNFLAIICENTADIKQFQETAKKETVPKHGLGLKIIRNITERYEGAIDTEYGADYYRIKVALPLI